MILKQWNELPDEMKNSQVNMYYNILCEHKNSLAFKRIFDILFSIILLVAFSPVFLVISLLIKFDSEGPIFYRQERVTQFNKVFKIHKFRTMINKADMVGTGVTVNNDDRITKVGKFLRKYRLDELPQLIDIFLGDMTFVGTRPESVKYVKYYTDEMFATLLLPAGVTSIASIKYKDEALLLDSAENADEVYVNKILPEKMKYNLQSIKDFSFLNELKTIFKTVYVVFTE